MMNPPHPDGAAVQQLAREALAAARVMNVPLATELLTDLMMIGEPQVMLAAMLWIDALRTHMLGGLDEQVEATGVALLQAAGSGAVYVLGSAKADTQLRPSVLWAADLMDAGVEYDLMRFRRTWRRAPDDETLAFFLADLLITIATTIETTPFGYALRDQAS